MGRRISSSSSSSSCCSNSKGGLQHKGPWTAREDALLVNYIQQHGEGHWRSLPNKAGLLRCGKSCRLRWMNYLRPNIKRGNITADEDDLIIKLHSLLGNRWSLIAGRLPGRTDNEIKNYWNSHLSKRLAINTENNAVDHQKAKKEKMMIINSNSENGETSNAVKSTRDSPFCNDDNPSGGVANGFPLPEGGGAETGMAVNGGNDQESGDLFGGGEVFYNCSANNGEVEDELNLQGEDYIQLESFIDYFLI